LVSKPNLGFEKTWETTSHLACSGNVAVSAMNGTSDSKSSVCVSGIGNAGFRVAAADFCVFVDAFYVAASWIGAPPCRRLQRVSANDLILVTHCHPDHFAPEDIAQRAGNGTVVGPGTVISRLRTLQPAIKTICMDPPKPEVGQSAQPVTVHVASVTIHAFRTLHSSDHNSYLVEAHGFRFFHDGDNEDTRRINVAALGRVDALFIAPWQGSGWTDFVQQLQPRKWFLSHLTEEELDQHAAGVFLPGICESVPLADRLVVLRPGQSCRIRLSP